MTTAEVMAEVVKDMPFYEESGGGVTFSGGEPLMQADFLISLLEACRRIGLHTAVDTSGHVSTQSLLTAAEKSDLLLYDLKHMSSAIHQKYTGVSNEVILDNLKSLDAGDARIQIRFPIIPGINDDKSNVQATGAFLQQRSNVECIDLLPLHSDLSSKYRRFGREYRLASRPAPDAAHMRRIAETLTDFGLRVTIGGNEHERADSKAATSQS
jgi:pyruvate formate lyase activating enzyme